MTEDTAGWEFDSDPDENCWYSRYNVQEMLTGVMTPMTHSTVWLEVDKGLQAAYRMLGQFDRAYEPYGLAKVFYGRPWYPIGDDARLAADCVLPGGRERLRDQFGVPAAHVATLGTGELSASDRGDDLAAALTDVMPPPALFEALNAVLGQPAVHQLTTVGDGNRERLLTLQSLPQTSDNKTLLSMLDSALSAIAPRYENLIVVSTCAGVGLRSLVSPLLALGLSHEDATSAAQRLVVVPTVSSTMLIELWSAANGQTSIEDVIEKYGARSDNEVELRTRVWRLEERSPRLLATSLFSSPNPAADLNSMATNADSLLAELETRAPEDVASILRPMVASVRVLIANRELAKFGCVNAIDTCRAIVDAAAETLCAADGDIYFWTQTELREALQGGNVPTDATIRARAAELSRLEGLVFAECALGRPRPAQRASTAEARTSFVGYGVAGGTVSGPARVVRSVDELSSIAPGDILIATTTDAAWTPAFMLAAGVVVDFGSRDSHAAIVAREFGLPCVVNTRSAVQTITDGDTVTVDGARGHVQVRKTRIVRTS